MKTLNKISSLTLSVVALTLIVTVWFSINLQPPAAINVFAGTDTYICLNENLNMSVLNATISGDVSDGDWITLGDGKFMPGNVSTIRFSANPTYIPGPNDKILGSYSLMLISDAPVNNPQAKVTDEVRIFFQPAPPIFCNNNLNISLNEQCIQPVSITMLQSNPQIPYSNYIITLHDQSGALIPDNILRRQHLDQEISFKIGHRCTQVTCWGKFKVEDYYPPQFICRNDTISCLKSSEPDSLGFPFPSTAYIDTIINKKYTVKNWDACSDVILEYTDQLIKANCARDEDKTITRKWKATDAKGNVSLCTELIVIKRLPLNNVVFPRNYDDHQGPAFECRDTFPILANGHPSPDTTGVPIINTCGNLEYQMTDTKFELCGQSFKIVRSWFVIEWCTSESITRNQIILVKDSKGPELICRDSIVLQSSPYICATDLVAIESPVDVSDCSFYGITYNLYANNGALANQFILVNGQGPFFNKLPVGQFSLEYVVTDACNNTSTCRTPIKVVDKATPNAVCNQFTKTSLDNIGFARVFAFTFDNGSTDNCAILNYKVRKMVDVCGNNTAFGDYVDFCCAELGTKQMVAFQVTDIYGNKNTCMVEVTVEDKIKPSITCPPNITLACTDFYDVNHLDDFGKVVTKASDRKNVVVNNFYHNGILGQDGLASDNCIVSVSQRYELDIHCFTGQIRRLFIATDGGGRKDSCTQIITILNPDPFDESNITWPAHYQADGCKSSQTLPETTGVPTFTNSQCGTISATYEDAPFYIADGACLKILRTWTVVDWCQFNGSNTIGKWGPYVQIIKLHNTDKPQFTSICRDTTICSYDTDCQFGNVDLTMTGVDSCTDVTDLIWSYTIDINRNGSVDINGNTARLKHDLPYGSHTVTWRLSDQCGNFSICTQVVTIVDCKNPSPYCISSITLPLMQPNGMIEVWAKDFDLGSYDNCTDTSDLWFTFDDALPVLTKINEQHYFTGQGQISTLAQYNLGLAQVWIPSTKSAGLLFDCADIPDGVSQSIMLDMTVTDESGNQDFCPVELILQDNANLCPDLITNGSVSGRIVSVNNKVPVGTTVTVNSVENNKSKIINNQGLYTVDSLPLGKEYEIKPTLNINPLDGVTTTDLVLIQRHILAIAPFDNPYKLIAADINSSKSVSAIDLVELRKLILGIKVSFPNNLPSWVFVPKDFTFTSNNSPYNYNSTIVIDNLASDVDSLDFIAVKIGDVNGTATGQVQTDEHVENRNKNIEIIVSKEVMDGVEQLVLRAGSEVPTEGLQLFLTYPNAEQLISNYAKGNDIFDDSEVFIQGDHVRMVAYSPYQKLLKVGDVIARFDIAHDKLDIKSLDNESGKLSAIFTDLQANNISLVIREKEVVDQTSFRLMTNPVSSQLVLKYNTADSDALQYTIFNAEGKSMLSSNVNLEIGVDQELSISLEDHLMPGIYFLKLVQGNYSETLKFIRIK